MRLFIIISLCAAIAGPASGQALLEYTLAAGGGSVAGIAGKSVSDGIDKIFRSLDKQLDSADAISKARTTKKKSDPWYGNMYSTASASHGSKVANPLMKLPSLKYDPAAAYLASPAKPPGRPVITPTQVAQVSPGASREQVVSSLGRPFARITIPEGNTLIEIYQYTSQGTTVGSLRLADGVVASVRVVMP